MSRKWFTNDTAILLYFEGLSLQLGDYAHNEKAQIQWSARSLLWNIWHTGIVWVISVEIDILPLINNLFHIIHIPHSAPQFNGLIFFRPLPALASSQSSLSSLIWRSIHSLTSLVAVFEFRSPFMTLPLKSKTALPPWYSVGFIRVDITQERVYQFRCKKIWGFRLWGT